MNYAHPISCILPTKKYINYSTIVHQTNWNNSAVKINDSELWGNLCRAEVGKRFVAKWLNKPCQPRKDVAPPNYKIVCNNSPKIVHSNQMISVQLRHTVLLVMEHVHRKVRSTTNLTISGSNLSKLPVQWGYFTSCVGPKYVY